MPEPETLLEVRNITMLFGSVIALSDVSAAVYRGEVTCLLGDNGAGKSTLIKILSGVHRPTEGEYFFEGRRVSFGSPREARAMGIATVYQDLSLLPLMPIWRNFFLGAEPERGRRPFRRFDQAFARRTVRDELLKMGIDIRDPDQPVGTMSGGERQSHRHRQGGLLRRKSAHPGRAHRRPGRQAGRHRAALHCAGPWPRPGGDFHLPQPPARLCRRRPLYHPQARPRAGGLDPSRAGS